MVSGQSCFPPYAMDAPVLTRGLFALLILAIQLPPESTASSLNCHKTCVCASNIVSCSRMNLTSVPLALPRYAAVLDLSFNNISHLRAEWTPIRLSRLHSLLLSHNGLIFLSSEAFHHVTKLRYLDLSSNGLRILEEFIFEPLESLEVLLLYNNHISQIDRSAFVGLMSLQKLYLSRNQIQRFPLELVKEKSRLEALTLLDVSSNKIKVLSIQELQVLPAWIKNSLYFHNNSLPCSCEMYTMVALWNLREFSSVVDYRDEHICLLPGKEKSAILDLNKQHLNCSAVKIMDQITYLEQYVVLDCDTKQKDMQKSWDLPKNAEVSFENQSAVLLPDGNLRIGPIQVMDSGVYTCYAEGDSQNETLYVTVMVHNFTMIAGLEGMKTAYTTLAGCLASIVMVFIYLYLTPCNCVCCPGQGLSKSAPGDSHSSTVSVTPTNQEAGLDGDEGGAKVPFNRHIAFLDPKHLLEQNGRLNPIGEEEDEWHEDRREGERRRSDAESISSVCSDTPMVV
ncbi:amphoterin-induced protein 1-like [Osmerus eperlanus]|uniref:amphoterin-induced protein 1-like n=1 Tax=Osmerus eperlanus TaxID=29151 RepID=UPI002E15CA2C